MNQLELYFKTFKIPPFIFLKKIKGKIKEMINNPFKRKKILTQSRQAEQYTPVDNSFIDIRSLNKGHIKEEHTEQLLNCYLNHYFDLLGSDWIKFSYRSKAEGFEGYSYSMNVYTDPIQNITELKNLLLPAHQAAAEKKLKLIEREYEPIDWQKDPKSGFRWNEKEWFKGQDQLSMNYKGADIKIPWEIGRLQHLPQMAVLTAINSKDSKLSVKEFKNQVLDFTAMNPPGVGVQWSSTMDVGIRVCNLLLAYDIFSDLDTNDVLDFNFKNIFDRSIKEHADHILNNLEYQESLTGNHYLFNIVGLL
ncbi:MAG: hypothetical protein ABEH43_08880, partial [Flavobacteriales bacterium]